MKKISSKNISKSPKKRKKRRISIYGDELEEEIKPLFEINKDLVFSNIAEIIATNIVEKIILNAFVEIRKKNLYSLMGIQCSNYLLKEINSLLSLSYICYEKENYFPSELEFNDNYLRYEIPLEECEISQPTAPLLDRWKVHRVNIIKHNKNQKSHERRKSREKTNNKSTKRKSKLKDNNNNKDIDIKKSLSKTQRNENKYEYIDVIEKAKMQREALRLFDSFPCFPITEFKPETNLTKEEEAQIASLREEILLKEDLKRKEEEKKRRLAFLGRNSRQEKDNIQKELEEKNKYKGKNIGVTSNGEIIFIQSVNVKNLKSEFLEISSKMNNDIENINSKRTSIIGNIQNRTKKSNKLDKKEIEKNKENIENEDLFKENNKNRINQQVIIGGSSFNIFVPEIGVNLRQGKGVKSGGNDFMNKYNKISFEQFEKTLEKFQKTNKENNELIEIKNDNETISTVKSRNNKNNEINNNNSNNIIINNLNQSNQIINSTMNRRRNTAMYNFNLSNTVNKNFERSSSLPDIFKANIIANMNNTSTNNNTNNINNDLTIKQSFNFTNYNNSFNFNNNSNINNNNSTRYNIYKHHNMSNFIKTSSSFKNLFFNNEVRNKDNTNNNITNNISTTSTNFFLNFNKNYKILSRPQAIISLKKMQTFNSDIVNDHNWGISQEKDIQNNIKMPYINVPKNHFDKNILRVRSNINEIYTKRKNILDRLSYRKIENEIKEYRDMSKRGLYKKSKSVK